MRPLLAWELLGNPALPFQVPVLPPRVLGHYGDGFRLPQDELPGHPGGSVVLRELGEGQERASAQHAFGVDVIDLEMGDLGDAQARAIGHTEGGLVFDTRCRFQ